MNDHIKLLEILNELYNMHKIELDCDYEPEFIEAINKLQDLIKSNINNINEIIDSLNFEESKENIILRYIPKIVRKLDTFEDQVKLIQSIKNQKEKYPNINFGFCIFYSELCYKFD